MLQIDLGKINITCFTITSCTNILVVGCCLLGFPQPSTSQAVACHGAGRGLAAGRHSPLPMRVTKGPG